MLVQTKLSLSSGGKDADFHSLSFLYPGRTVVPTEFGGRGVGAAQGYNTIEAKCYSWRFWNQSFSTCHMPLISFQSPEIINFGSSVCFQVVLWGKDLPSSLFHHALRTMMNIITTLTMCQILFKVLD